MGLEAKSAPLPDFSGLFAKSAKQAEKQAENAF
jgi:hypothetical protein